MHRQPRHPLRDLLLLLGLSLVVGVALEAPANADGGTVARVKCWHVTCSTTVQALSPPTSLGQAAKGAQSFKLINASGGTNIFLGGSELTNANTATLGALYLAGQSDSFDAHPESMFCVTTSSTSDVTVLAGKF